MNNIRVAGIDDGRVNKKIYTMGSDGKLIEYVATNCICPGYKRRTTGEKVEDLKDRLHAVVVRNGVELGEYFTGRLALDANRDDLRMQSAGIHKFAAEKKTDDSVKIVMDLAYITFDQGENELNFLVGYGVPAEEYYEGLDTSEFETYLKAQWEVRWQDPAFHGAITKIGVVDIDEKGLEGAASLLSAAYDDDLQIRPEVEKLLAKGDLLGVNLGSSTFDGAGMRADMSFIPQLFFGVEQGTNKAINRSKSMIKTKHDVEIKPLLLDHYMRVSSVIRAKGEEINLQEIGTVAYGDLISKIKTEYLNKLEEVGYESHKAGGIILFGGLVENVIKRFPEHTRSLNGWLGKTQTILSENALIDEARGYYIKALIKQMMPVDATVDDIATEAAEENQMDSSGIEIVI